MKAECRNTTHILNVITSYFILIIFSTVVAAGVNVATCLNTPAFSLSFEPILAMF